MHLQGCHAAATTCLRLATTVKMTGYSKFENGHKKAASTEDFVCFLTGYFPCETGFFSKLNDSPAFVMQLLHAHFLRSYLRLSLAVFLRRNQRNLFLRSWLREATENSTQRIVTGEQEIERKTEKFSKPSLEPPSAMFSSCYQVNACNGLWDAIDQLNF